MRERRRSSAGGCAALAAALVALAAPALAAGPPLLVLEPALADAPAWYPAPEGEPGWRTAPAPLQAEDLRALHAAVAARVARVTGLAPVPDADMDRARRLADQGRLREGGPTCRLAPDLVRVVAAAGAEPVVAEPRVHCHVAGRDCALTVTLHGQYGAPALDGVPRELRASVRGRPSDARAWLAAAKQLAPATPGAGGPAASVVLAAGTRPELRAVTRFGAWQADLEGATDALKPTLVAARACEEATPLPGGAVAAFALDAGADGRVERVTVRVHPNGHDPARPAPGRAAAELGACLERGLAGARFPAEAGRDRRVTGLVRLPGASRVSVTWKAPRVTDASLDPDLGLAVPAFRAALLACWSPLDAPGPGALERAVRLRIGPDGQVAEARVPAPDAGRADHAGACLQKALLEARWTCPGEGRAVLVSGTLAVNVAPARP